MVTSKALKIILLWGVLLFAFNYTALFVLIFILGQASGALIFGFLQYASVAFAGYQGVLSFGGSVQKEKSYVIKNISAALIIGGLIALISSLLFILAALIFSGEFVFGGFGIIIGAAGGYFARQKLQNKK